MLARKLPSSPRQGSVASLQLLLLFGVFGNFAMTNHTGTSEMASSNQQRSQWCWRVKSCREARWSMSWTRWRQGKLKQEGQPGPGPLLSICAPIFIGNLRVRDSFHPQGGLLKSSQSTVIVKPWKPQRQFGGPPHKK